MKTSCLLRCIFTLTIITPHGIIRCENDNLIKTIENIVYKNPEIVQKSLNNHIKRIIDKNKQAAVKIYGSLENDLNNNKKGKNALPKNIKNIKEHSDIEYSGFFISSDGYIISNYSPLKGFESLYIDDYNSKEKKKIKLKNVGYDESSDIIILKAEIKTQNYLEIGRNTVNKESSEYIYPIQGTEYKLSKQTNVEYNNYNRKKNKKNGVETYNYSQNYSNITPLALIDINGNFVGFKVFNGGYLSNKLDYYNSIIPLKNLSQIIECIKKNGYNICETDNFSIVPLNDKIKSLKRIKVSNGCYIEEIKNNILKKYDLNKGDTIVKINNYSVNDIISFEKIFNLNKNSDICFEIYRDGKNKKVCIPSGILGDIKYEYKNNELIISGAQLINLTKDQKDQIAKINKKNNFKGGILISKFFNKEKWRCHENFVITKINRHEVSKIEDFVMILKNIPKRTYEGKVEIEPLLIQGFYIEESEKEKKCFALQL